MVKLKNSSKKKKDILDFFGIWKDKKELDKIEKIIYEDRKKSKLRDVKFD